MGPVLAVAAGANYSMGVTKWGNLGKCSMYVFYFNSFELASLNMFASLSVVMTLSSPKIQQ